MIKPEELQAFCTYNIDGKIETVGTLFWEEFIQDPELKHVSAIELTKQILHDNLGFEVTDFGEYWEFLKNGFVMHQPKLAIIEGLEMPFIFAYKIIEPKSINIKQVHQLQIIYKAFNQETLVWKP